MMGDKTTIVSVVRERGVFSVFLSGTWGQSVHYFTMQPARDVVRGLSKELEQYDQEEWALTNEYGPRYHE